MTDNNIWQQYLNGEIDFVDIEQEDISKNMSVDHIKLDLHSFTEDEAFNKLCEIVNLAYQNNVREIMVVTGVNLKDGEATGKLYQQLPRWLEYSEIAKYISSFNYQDDNKGAILIKLKKQEN